MVTAVHLAKREPRRPAVLCLLGPTGVGKTSAIQALPEALDESGYAGAHVHRIDCGEIATHGDVSRLIGAPPGYVGSDETPPVYRALDRPGCILLLDELEKGHHELRRALVSFLGNAELRTPQGSRVDSGRAIVALTTNADADQLASRLHRIEPGNRTAIDAACREHLREIGWAPELVARIDAMAVFAPLPADALQRAADQAIRGQAREFGLEIRAVELVLADVVVDLSLRRGAGARGLDHAARDLLGEQLAAAVREGLEGPIDVLTGPPPAVVAAGG